MPIRSGPFSLNVPANDTETHQIVYGNLGAVYRIFNSTDRANPSDKKITLTNRADAGNYVGVPTTAEIQNLHATMSIDVAVGPTDNQTDRPAGIRVTAHNSTGNAEQIEGSYDLVRDARGIIAAGESRSGRFNFPRRVNNAFLPVLLIDLTHSQQTAVYRFINTGDFAFDVFTATDEVGTGEMFRKTVESKRAIDIEISHATIRRVWVDRIAAGDHIRGVFEMVG